MSDKVIQTGIYKDEGFNLYPESTFTRQGYNLAYWKDSESNLYTPTQYILFPESKSLSATWYPITYKISFNGNGADSGAMSQMTCLYDLVYNLTKNNFVKLNYNFKQWNSKDGIVYSDQQLFRNLTSIDNTTIELSAEWKKSEIPDSGIWYATIYGNKSGTGTPVLDKVELSYRYISSTKCNGWANQDSASYMSTLIYVYKDKSDNKWKIGYGAYLTGFVGWAEIPTDDFADTHIECVSDDGHDVLRKCIFDYVPES